MLLVFLLILKLLGEKRCPLLGEPVLLGPTNRSEHQKVCSTTENASTCDQTIHPQLEPVEIRSRKQEHDDDSLAQGEQSVGRASPRADPMEGHHERHQHRGKGKARARLYERLGSHLTS